MSFLELRETPRVLSVLSTGRGHWLRAKGRLHAVAGRERRGRSLRAKGQEAAEEGPAGTMEQTHQVSNAEGEVQVPREV